MLKPLQLTPFTAKELKPRGWLKRQLEIQAAGLSGALDKIWPDIRDSSWIGGTRDGWERVPYWLDGFIPLAWLLDDMDMKTRAKKYIDGILNGQQEDGWICPCAQEESSRYDVWTVFLICKVLAVYHDCTEDARIPVAIEKALWQLYCHVSKNTLFNWGACRWFECLIPIFWLYERTNAEWLLDLAALLEAEGLDYERLAGQIIEKAPQEARYWTYQNHVVNVAMAMKSRALMSRMTGEDPNAFARDFHKRLIQRHGMANGHFTGDECLSGKGVIQGSELCGVVEAMYSYEWLVTLTGDPYWSDVLEKTAYNAFPAAFTPDMWAHQYVQMSNQMQCTPLNEESIPFNSNNGEAHIFGLEPHFGCCTANFSQGWPKFALSAIMKSEKGFVVTAVAPVSICSEFNCTGVQISIETEYPFRDDYTVAVQTNVPCTFELSLRIPSFCRSATVDGNQAEPGTYYHVLKEFSGSISIPVHLELETAYSTRETGLTTVWRGPLLFALPVKAEETRVEYVKDGVERKFPYCDYYFHPASPWNFAYCNASLEVMQAPMGAYMFSPDAPPVRIHTKAAQHPWHDAGGICAPYPEDWNGQALQVQEIDLIPYGCTVLRMTELPSNSGELEEGTYGHSVF